MARNNVRQVKKNLEKWRIREGDGFTKKLTKVTKLASVDLQRKIKGSIDRPTRFTENAIGFQFTSDQYSCTNRIYLKDIQAKYLQGLIDKNTLFEKMIPVAQNRTNKFGNITGLNKGKLVKIEHKDGREYLINPKRRTTKKLGSSNRIVAVKATTPRRKSIGSWDKIRQDVIKRVNTRMNYD